MADADRPKDWVGLPNKPLMRMVKANESRPLQGMAATNLQPPTSDAARFQTVAALVRSEIARADWTERQSRVAEFMVAATLDRGRQEVKGINLEELGTLLGISKGNVSDVFYELQLCGFLQVIDGPRGATGPTTKVYRVLPAAEHWSVRWRYDQAALGSYLAALDVATGHAQNELFEPEPDLKGAIAECQLENVNKEGRRSAIVPTNEAARFSISPRASTNREPLSEISNSSSSVPDGRRSAIVPTNGVRGVRVLEEGFSIMGSSRGSSEGVRDFTDSQKAVKVIGDVPDSGTGEQVAGVNGKWKMENGKYEGTGVWADDGYIVDKLRTPGEKLFERLKLFEELWEGRTRLARDFSALYSVRPQKARELIGSAVSAQSPARWLNVAVGQYWRFNREVRA